jgi:predicted DNA-binding transcriptional regulator YafY
MAENTALTRQWGLLQILTARRNGATVRELVAETGVVDKTIRRDLQFLARLGFPLTEVVGDYGRKSWKLDGGPGVPSLKFNLTEVLSFYLARRFLEPLAGTHVWTGAQSAFKKIRATLSNGAIEYLDKLARVFQQTPLAAGDYSKHADLIEQLLIATEDRRIAWIVYQSARATEPVSICWHMHARMTKSKPTSSTASARSMFRT